MYTLYPTTQLTRSMPSLGANEAINMTADAESRRAKKRQTDRNAQRQHRKRQKQYIEGLEAQISLLKSAGKTEASQLAAQNLQLQDEVGLLSFNLPEVRWLTESAAPTNARSLGRDGEHTATPTRPKIKLDTQCTIGLF